MIRRRLRLLPEILLAGLAWCVIPFLPRCCVVGLARVGGRVAWCVSRRERKISLANLDLVYGDTLSSGEKDALGRASFQSFALTLLDLFWFSRFTESRYRRFIDIDPKMAEILQTAPLIGVTGHVGNWEIISMIFGMEGNPTTAVAMPLKNPFVGRMLRRLRIRTGSVPVPRAGAVRTLLQTLRSKGAIGLLLDQNTHPKEGGIFVPFFGLPVAVSNAAGLLAKKTNVAVVVVIAVADKKGFYHFACSDLLLPEGLTAAEITVAVTHQLETMIRQYPHDWLWSYKRWRYYRDGDDPARFPYYAACLKRKPGGRVK
ncbi:MAG: lysophospholipid acyltransferase family protein [Kiritimatiellia bacterium]